MTAVNVSQSVNSNTYLQTEIQLYTSVLLNVNSSFAPFDRISFCFRCTRVNQDHFPHFEMFPIKHHHHDAHQLWTGSWSATKEKDWVWRILEVTTLFSLVLVALWELVPQTNSKKLERFTFSVGRCNLGPLLIMFTVWYIFNYQAAI